MSKLSKVIPKTKDTKPVTKVGATVKMSRKLK